jgi:thymidylate kinase
MDYFNDSHILENSVILLFQISNETANEREMFRRATSSKALDVNDEQDDSFKRKVNSNYNDIIEMVQDKRSRHPEKPFIMSMISDICIIDGNEGYMDVNEKVIEMLQQDIKTRMGDRNHD